MATPPKTVRLQDYEPYPFRVEATALGFDIRDGETTVTCELDVRRSGPGPLVLHGVDLDLQSLSVDGRALAGNEYARDAATLTLFDVPEACRVRSVVRIVPEKNTALDGLYKSRGMYCTQCEPEGFRKITYYPDRPDVLSRFTTTITADAERCPVVLSNGNLRSEAVADGRRTVTWADPFPKPSYLFALVAGDLAVREDAFVTCSGRRVALRVYSEPHNIEQCGYAVGALKRAMRWDEERFGREYDLDVFMIVAVEDFNNGAMENKGLNLFNTACLLASPDTATDAGYQRVEGVVAHEYFHNWSGNRVTCRDWFQLSLKEGFTVYRDSEFSADMHSRTVKRVQDVDFLRTVQFAEDAGPLAHPVRPDSYRKISNFYTTTVYEKGAEVVRMVDTIVGRRGFRAGTDLYFDRHDGAAVTTEDFVTAVEDANDARLPQLRRWYTQAGTPLLTVAETRADGDLALEVAQSCPPTPGQPEKSPFHIPVAFGLVDAAGRDLLGAAGEAVASPVIVDAAARVENPNRDGTLVLHATEPTTRVRLRGAPADAEVSFLRAFSAPVRVDYPRRPEALRRLAVCDSDGFARWDAARELASRAVLAGVAAGEGGGERDAADALTGLFSELAERAADAPDDGEAKALLALLLTLPEETSLLARAPGTDILAICAAWDALALRLAGSIDWLALADASRAPKPYQPAPADAARRMLRHRALAYAVRDLDQRDPARAEGLLADLLADADNLTDRLAALDGLLGLASLAKASKRRYVDAFHDRWASVALVVDAWFRAQARCPLPGGLGRVRALARHPAFDIKNPNKVRALVFAFTINPRNFHLADGSAYAWLAERVRQLDALNPQVAARLAKTLTEWPRFDAGRGGLMRDALRTIGAGDCSSDVREVVDKGLAGAPSAA